jgi:hypothetical protein
MGNRFGCRNGSTATLKPDELVLHAEDHLLVYVTSRDWKFGKFCIDCRRTAANH